MSWVKFFFWKQIPITQSRWLLCPCSEWVRRDIKMFKRPVYKKGCLKNAAENFLQVNWILGANFHDNIITTGIVPAWGKYKPITIIN